MSPRLALLLLASLLVRACGYGIDITFYDGIVYPLGWTLAYWYSLPMKRILIWGGDVGEGKQMSRIAHNRCSLILIVGKDPAVAETAAAELYAEKPLVGVCAPGVDPVVAWDVGDINNATFVLHLTDRYRSTMGGPPDIAWNFAEITV
eukprot:gb/GFBE01012484.1/.p1 GENE.gb/GFBE01012484.1/~~gb/GFBE01012484.1/.p1  ORF type:complete len:148 (+),score=21.73 gb/GFBE01012484.1/:1-444(+)